MTCLSVSRKVIKKKTKQNIIIIILGTTVWRGGLSLLTEALNSSFKATSGIPWKP